MKMKNLLSICIFSLLTVNLTYARWPQPDPKAENYYPQSPYAFSSNNPINRVDKDGKADDWVRNIQDDKYVWMDNVTSPSNTPQGYIYIGANGSNIISDLNIQPTYPTQTDNIHGVGILGGDGTGPLGQGVPTYTGVSAQGTITAEANISMNPQNVTANNSAGLGFDGVTVTGTLIQTPKSREESTRLEAKGALNVVYGGQNNFSTLTTPQGANLTPTGSVVKTASVTIPAGAINSSKGFSTATITAASPNPNVVSSNIKMVWPMQPKPVFRPK